MDVEFSDQSLLNLTLVRQMTSPVRRLRGFRKSHQVPAENTEQTRSFVARISADDISEDLQERHTAFRQILKFKRTDMNVMAPESGVGRIVTPWFDYEVRAVLCHTDPATVTWRRQLSELRSARKLLSSPLSIVFGKYFDTVELQLSESPNIPEVIDRLEAAELDAVTLDYDLYATRVSVALRGVAGQLELTSDRVALIVEAPESANCLLEAFSRMREQLDCIAFIQGPAAS